MRGEFALCKFTRRLRKSLLFFAEAKIHGAKSPDWECGSRRLVAPRDAV
jgi:hypothetical protein